MQALNIAEYAILNATKCYCVDYTFSDQSISLFDRNPRIPNDLTLEDLAEMMQNCITSHVCNWRLLNVCQLLHEKEMRDVVIIQFVCYIFRGFKCCFSRSK